MEQNKSQSKEDLDEPNLYPAQLHERTKRFSVEKADLLQASTLLMTLQDLSCYHENMGSQNISKLEHKLVTKNESLQYQQLKTKIQVAKTSEVSKVDMLYSGCDFKCLWVDKSIDLKLITTDTNFQKHAVAFNNKEITKRAIEEVGKVALLIVNNRGKGH